MVVEKSIKVTFVEVSSRLTSNETHESISTLQVLGVDDQSEAKDESKANKDDESNNDSNANPTGEANETNLPKGWGFTKTILKRTYSQNLLKR